MKYINRILILFALLALPLGLMQTGCQSTPNRIAHNTTSIAVTSANAAVQGWWDYKKQFPNYSREADAKIKDAYGKYQAVMKLSADAYESYLSNTNNAPGWQLSLSTVAATEADLINLIAEFLPKGK
jgi:hypothetical protein